jgi:WD40 repeat protein
VAAAKDDGGEDAKKKKKEKKKKKKEKKRKETEINIEDAIDTERATPSSDATTTNKAPNSNSTPTKKAEKDTEAGKSQTKKRKKADKKSPSEPAEKVAKVSNAKAAKDGIESGDDAKKQQPETTPEPKKKKEIKEKKKRPLSGYLMFLAHVREETKKEVIANAEGGAPFEGTELNQAIMKAGAAKWKALSDEEKTKWKNTEQPQSSKDTNADAPSTSSPPVATGGEDAKEKRQKKKRKRKSKGKSDATETTDDLPTPEQKEGTPRGHEQAVEKSTGNEGEQISWTDDFSRFDFRCSHISYLSELSTQAPIDNFFKGAKWSPDGFLLLTASNDNCVRMFETPVEPSELVPSSSPNEEEVSELSQVGEHAVGGLIYDYAWYSRMATIDAASCCYAVSSRGNPVHLLDGATHKLRCTYKAHDSADELVSANSLAFHPDGELLVCGYKRSVVEFNLARPGMSEHAHSTLESGQRGIISTIDFSSASHSFVACGCYDGTIGFYDMNSGWGKSVQTLLGHERGVTQVMFDRYGNYLYSGGRRDGFVHCWDTRFVTKHPLYSLKRPGVIDTNQTIEFDIDPHNKYLISGGVDGTASVFDLNDGKKVKEVHVSEPGAAANGISINQSSQWSLYFAVSSGNYQFDRSTEADVSRVNSLKLYNISKRLV